MPSGTTCHDDEYWGAKAPCLFARLPYVTVKKAGVQQGIMGSQPCTTVIWTKATHLEVQIGNDEQGELPVGHLVVDKVGEEQQISGVIATPFKSHFEWYPVGKGMQARHLAQPASQTPDREAELVKRR